jgi:hypothetical protein
MRSAQTDFIRPVIRWPLDDEQGVDESTVGSHEEVPL